MKDLRQTDIRDAFFDQLYEIAKTDPRVMFLTADMGAFSLLRFKKDLPRQYYNVGVAEQNMISVAAGLALAGKKVFVYSIIPFTTLRCFEQIKIDFCCMRLPVTIVGMGPGLTYGSDGPTHHAIHDVAVMRTLPEMTIYNPSDAVSSQACARLAYDSRTPCYIRLEKGCLPVNHAPDDTFRDGLKVTRAGRQITLIASGMMVHTAHEAARILEQDAGLSVRVVDLYRLKPMNEEKILWLADSSQGLITLEENCLSGAIGSSVAEVLVDHRRTTPLKRIALPDQHCLTLGTREILLGTLGLDAQGISRTVGAWWREIQQ